MYKTASFLSILLFSFQGHAHEISSSHDHTAQFIPSAIEQAKVSITKDQNYRYIKSNGIPNHTTGQFPNRGNPNAISAQNHQYRVPLRPQKNNKPTQKHGTIGVALNGIPFEPGTAEFWNNDRSSGWNYEALSGKINLGLDNSNAHVQPTGNYHYHGIPYAITGGALKQIGYASDGFPIFAGRAHSYKAGYKLKSGYRSSGPGGKYDGTFTADYEYIAGHGNLDACNGTYLNEQYVYILTKEFPHIPRCLFGTADESFERRGGPGAGQAQRHERPPRGQGHRPPPRHHSF